MYRITFSAVLLSILLSSGCSKTPNVVGESKIQVYPESRLDDKEVFYASVGESLSRLEDVAITSWTFSASASMDEIASFYMKAFPNAEQDAEPGDPDDEEYPPSVIIWIPTNDPDIDELTIEVYDGQYIISESVYE